MTSTDLDKIVFTEAIRRVNSQYGIYSQFQIMGDTKSNFMLVPRTDVGYDAIDMDNLSEDIDFLSEVIKTECEL